MCVKPAAILVPPDPVFTVGKELLIEMVNQEDSDHILKLIKQIRDGGPQA